MKPIGGRQMCRLLEAKGWRLARITGSHHIFVREGVNLRITVPVHGNADLKVGLQKAIMKFSGVSDKDL